MSNEPGAGSIDKVQPGAKGNNARGKTGDRLQGGSEGSTYIQCRAEVHQGDRAETELEPNSPTPSL